MALHAAARFPCRNCCNAAQATVPGMRVFTRLAKANCGQPTWFRALAVDQPHFLEGRIWRVRLVAWRRQPCKSLRTLPHQ